MLFAFSALAAGCAIAAAATPPAHTFKVQDGRFLLDGKPFVMVSGEMHYARIPRPLWRQRIKMAKAMGLNTVAVYCFWNVHEPEKGKFDFSGNADVHEFIRECSEEGLLVLLRPGPYVCAEWDFGGYPYWLLNEPGLAVRTRDANFMAYCKSYLAKLHAQVAEELVSKGGPILMTQVENEYGSYGKDHEFMAQGRDMLKDVGFDVPLYVAEGDTQLANAWVPGTVPGVNGGSWPDCKKTVDKYMPGGPYLVPEFYPGWLDHWGEDFIKTDGDVAAFADLIKNGVSTSLYMFHGGTNFGFMNGANWDGHFQPSITSYDYDAPLDEAGRPTPKYFKFRDAIAKVTGVEPPPVPASPKVVTVPRFTLAHVGDFHSALGKTTRSGHPLPMESLGQAYGYTLYQTRLPAGPCKLDLANVRDYAVVMAGGAAVGMADRHSKQTQAEFTNGGGNGAPLSLVVENGGRINYGQELPNNRKGLVGDVTCNGLPLLNWACTPLNLNSVPKSFNGKAGNPGFYKGVFQLDETGEMFLDCRGWQKGVVWVNGHNLGRFWEIGPQMSLYVPSCWLKMGKNDVVVFELGVPANPEMQGLAEPILAAKPRK